MRHGTFYRLRVVVHIDSLDQVLLSSREAIDQSELTKATRHLLHACFNFARNKLEAYDVKHDGPQSLGSKLDVANPAITRAPLVQLAISVALGQRQSRYLSVAPKVQEDIQEFALTFVPSDEAKGILRTSVSQELTSDDLLARFDADDKKLIVNTLHPFVSAIMAEDENTEVNSLLHLICMAEVLTEAYLCEVIDDATLINGVLESRDQLLRALAKTRGRRSAAAVADALRRASGNADQFEIEITAAMEVLGFSCTRLGGKGKPDGRATAVISATADGQAEKYVVGYEAKSGGTASAHRVGVSTLTRHIREYKVDFHLVVAPGFDAADKSGGALANEVTSADTGTPSYKLSICELDDFAWIVKHAPLKRISLVDLKQLFFSCRMPPQIKEWINNINARAIAPIPFEAILEEIYNLSDHRQDEAISVQAVSVGLASRNPPVNSTKKEVLSVCQIMATLVPGFVSVTGEAVSIASSPAAILIALKGVLSTNYTGESGQA